MSASKRPWPATREIARRVAESAEAGPAARARAAWEGWWAMESAEIPSLVGFLRPV